MDGDQRSPPSEGSFCAEAHRRNRSALDEDGRGHLRRREQHEPKHEGEKKQVCLENSRKPGCLRDE